VGLKNSSRYPYIYRFFLLFFVSFFFKKKNIIVFDSASHAPVLLILVKGWNPVSRLAWNRLFVACDSSSKLPAFWVPVWWNWDNRWLKIYSRIKSSAPCNNKIKRSHSAPTLFRSALLNSSLHIFLDTLQYYCLFSNNLSAMRGIQTTLGN